MHANSKIYSLCHVAIFGRNVLSDTLHVTGVVKDIDIPAAGVEPFDGDKQPQNLLKEKLIKFV